MMAQLTPANFGVSAFNCPIHIVNAGYERYFSELAEPVTRSDGGTVRALD